MARSVPDLCRPSPIYVDWVEKGFHLHVGRVELVVRPGHKVGMVVLKRFFRGDAPTAVEEARRLVVEQCLASAVVRARWVATLGRAMEYLNGYAGPLAERANGRKYEFRRLQRALQHYRED